ncbi:MAG: tetratricopeptide repeat protein [candidate division WOR-3 bacterium]|nr:tetratricopeptide repeat protein [candidate division WOR-3 bacterium]
MKAKMDFLKSFENEELFLNTIKYLSDVMDSRDVYTLGHSERVQKYAVRMGRKMNLSSRQMDALYLASILHDIGKVKVPIDILKSGKKLSKYEFVEMKRHAFYGAHLLGSFRYVEGVQEAIRHHHERYDGNGYPDGLKHDEIPLIARIISVCDAYDAMTSNRSYKKEINAENYAVSELRANKGKQFDPYAVDIFIDLYNEGYISMEKGLYYMSQSNAHSDELAEYFLERAYNLMNDKYLREFINYNIGKLRLKHIDYESALKKFRRFLRYAKDDIIKADIYNNIASVYFNQGKYSNALRYLNKTIKMKGISLEKARAFRYVGNIYFERGKSPEDVIETLDKSREMHNKIEMDIENQKKNLIEKDFSIVRYNRLINFKKELQMDTAKHDDVMGFMHYNYCNFEKAIDYYRQSINLKHFYSDLYGSVRSQSGLALVYIDKKLFKQAEFNLNESMTICENMNDTAGKAMIYNNMGRLYLYWNKKKKAKEFYKKACELAFSIDKKSIARESCRHNLFSYKTKKAQKRLRNKYVKKWPDENASILSDYMIRHFDDMTDKDLKKRYKQTLRFLKKQHKILDHAKTYYLFLKFLKRTDDREHKKYIEGIPEITAQLSGSMIKRRLEKIYDFNKEVSDNKRSGRKSG